MLHIPDLLDGPGEGAAGGFEPQTQIQVQGRVARRRGTTAKGDCGTVGRQETVCTRTASKERDIGAAPREVAVGSQRVSDEGSYDKYTEPHFEGRKSIKLRDRVSCVIGGER